MKFAYIVYDVGRKTKIFFRRSFAERHRLLATCGRCHPPNTCPHYWESWIVKTRYTNLQDILKQYDVGKRM